MRLMVVPTIEKSIELNWYSVEYQIDHQNAETKRRLDTKMAEISQKGALMLANDVIQKSQEVMGGTAVFKGTRVPVKTLLDYIEGGDTVDQFLSDFPTVSREQVSQVLQIIKNKLLDEVA
jgi:uncharacterized protein (DUF433 family)